MSIKLNIENDAEFRAYIKECIVGQVKAIVREEFANIIKGEIKRKVASLDKWRFDRVISDATALEVRSILVGERWDDIVAAQMDNTLTRILSQRDWKEEVDTLVKEKIQKLIS